MERYEGVVDGRLEEPARLSPALVERLAEPLFGLYRDMADRLAATGDVYLGLVTRRSLIELLRRLTEQPGHSARAQLASALADLAADLLRLDRVDEAAAAAAEASAAATQARTAVQDLSRGVVTPSARSVTWTPLSSSASYAAGPAAGAGTSGAEPAAFMAERQRRTAAWLEAGRPEAYRLEQDRLAQARLDAQRRETERVAAERAAAERRAAERAAAERAERLEAERRAAAEEAERAERKRRRAERIEAHRLEVERREAERLEAERLAAERLEAERLESDP
jgi:hypothetical protein